MLLLQFIEIFQQIFRKIYVLKILHTLVYSAIWMNIHYCCSAGEVCTNSSLKQYYIFRFFFCSLFFTSTCLVDVCRLTFALSQIKPTATSTVVPVLFSLSRDSGTQFAKTWLTKLYISNIV